MKPVSESVEIEQKGITNEKPHYSQALDNLQRASLSLSIENHTEPPKDCEESIVDQTSKLANNESNNVQACISIGNTKVQRENSNSSTSSFSIAGKMFDHCLCKKDISRQI